MILRPLLLTEQPEDGRDNPGPNPLQDRGMTSFPESATGVARGTFAGIGLMLAGTFLFSVHAALGKWLLADYSVGELLLVRSFAGVVLALRPSGASFTLPVLIALAGSVTFAFLMIVTRVLRETTDTVLVVGQIGGTFVFGALTAPFGWVTPSPRDLVLLTLFGVLAMLALACVNRSLKLAPASVVAPYQYTLIVWAIMLGYLVFGDVPDLATLVGAAIIIAAGLFIFWREQVRGRRVAAVVEPP